MKLNKTLLLIIQSFKLIAKIFINWINLFKVEQITFLALVFVSEMKLNVI